MRPRAQSHILDRLEREYGPAIRRAFERSVKDWRRRINMADVTRMIGAGDIAGVLAAVGVADTVFRDLEVEIARAFEGAGRAFTSFLPRNVRDPRGLAVQFRFDLRHPGAEAWLRREAAGLVTRIADDQRAAIRAFLTDGLQQGIAPRTTALRLAGIVNRTTGIREGGIIGLSEPQTRYLRDMRSALTASDGKPFGYAFDESGNLARKFWISRKGEVESVYTLRDRNFDSAILRSLRDGDAFPASARERASTHYSNRLLRHRGRQIGNHETLKALSAGQHNANMQAIETAQIPDQYVTRKWRHSGKAEPRPDHVAFSGTTVNANEPYVLPSGARLMYPRDTSLGAGAEDVIGCGCIEEVNIDFIGLQADRERLAA